MSQPSVSPKISVIMAVYNAETTIARAISSFLDQDYENKQLILIDGGSTDGTLDIIKSFDDEIDYWVSEPDNGIYNAWNKGLNQSVDEWICFLGADDYFWEPSSLSKMVKYLVSAPDNIRLVYGNVVLVNQNNEKILTVGKPWNQAKAVFGDLMSIPHPGAMHKKSLFLDHGKFDERFRIAGDYEFLLRELKQADAFYAEDVLIAGMQQGGVSSNPIGTIKQLREVRAAQKQHGYSSPGRRWVLAVLRCYIRVFFWRLLGEKNTKMLMDLFRVAVGKPKFWTKT